MTKRLQIAKQFSTMSTQQAPAHHMSETSVIKHYKKQLIYRQHDVPEAIGKHSPPFLNEVGNTKIYDLVESEKAKSKIETNGKKIRRKRKNKNCRGQFRHEAMELIKLGANASHSMCKSKEPHGTRMEKPQHEITPNKDDRNVPQNKSDNVQEATNPTVIQTNYVKKTILENPAPNASQFGHALPQMVPERRNSRELHPKVPVIYQSPPPRPLLPEYRVPAHPPYPLPHPNYAHPPLAFRPTPTLPPPPPYPIARSPPRPVPRSPIRPIPQPAYQKNVPYPGIHYPYPRQPEYNNGFHKFPPDYQDREKKRRKHEEKPDTRPVVAAIDLTVDQNADKTHKHKCKCECGKMYPSEAQEVIITVKDRDSSQVPSTYIRGKMVNGVLQFDQNSKNKTQPNSQNGFAKSSPPTVIKGQTPEVKLPQLFLIDDLLANNKKDTRQEKNDLGKLKEDKTIPPVPIRTEPNRVIITSTRKVEEPIPRPKSKDYSVSTIIGSDNRRQSVDIDTISISSSSSESVRSPRPKSNGVEKQVPYGKLFHYKNNNSFIRYFDETQKKLFIESITSDGQNYEKKGPEEVIKLPMNAIFNSKDSLTVEEYVSEMTLVEKFIPKDFFLFYKFVTGYQICNNNLPVSFLTFLKVYNTNGLKNLLDRYISSLKQN